MTLHWTERPKPGSVIEYWMWADGKETPEVLAQYRVDLQTAVAREANRHGVLVTPVVFAEKRPGEPFVPDVPKHIQGPNVRLVGGRATVIGEATLRINSFLSDLDLKDLKRLRTITRRIHYGLKPDGTKRALSNAEVDRVIEEYGPEAAADVIRQGMASEMVH